MNAPPGFSEKLELPTEVTVNSKSRKPLDFAMLFAKREKDLKKDFSKYKSKLKPTGMLWVSWPKKSSGATTELSETNVRTIGLAAGLVDTKICAVNDIWSGLKFMFRLKDRPKP